MLPVGPHVEATVVAREARTLGDMFRRRVRHSGDYPALYAKEGSSSWIPTTWSEFEERAAQVAHTLLQLGLEPGDRVAILGATQKPWGYFDIGAQLAGMVGVGIYPKQAPEQIRYIIEHAGARVVFVDEAAELENVITACEGNDDVVAIVPWQQAEYDQFRDADERVTDPLRFVEERLGDAEIDRIQEAIDRDDTAILIYTSGTTGPPKGAMITHDNILTLLSSVDDVLAVYEDDISYSFLPMAHAAERVLAFYGRINLGFATAYASSIGAVLDELKEVRPTVFGSVPRIFEKAYGAIQARLAKQSNFVQRLARWAVRVGKQRLPYVLEERPVPLGLRMRYAIADRLVFSKVREAFGGRVRLCIVGAAPTAPTILQFFWAAGLPLYEVYGMTESTVITHANRPGTVRLGTVGPPVGPMEQKIAADGEILVRGPYVFKGYFRNPEATAETLEDGWLHTGDIGSVDEDGYLRITDRKKHLIITAGGKNLTPANIENAIKNESPLIHQVHAHGDQRPYISALIAPSALETLELGVERGLIEEEELAARREELMKNPAGRSDALNQATAKVVGDETFRQAIFEAVQRGNAQLARVEKVRRYYILEHDFSLEGGELTPSMKLKRKAVETKYADIFDRIYEDEDFAVNVTR